MGLSMITHFRTMAIYNRRANKAIYEACAQLSQEERTRKRPAFFGSIHGTLNHILVGDRIWLDRFAGRTMPSINLDAILYEGFEDLRGAREAEDARIESFAADLDGTFLAGAFSYVNNSGKACTDPTAVLVAHLFNHQTHHRGQVHGMLSQTAVPPPSLDLHRMLDR